MPYCMSISDWTESCIVFMNFLGEPEDWKSCINFVWFIIHGVFCSLSQNAIEIQVLHLHLIVCVKVWNVCVVFKYALADVS